MKTNRTIIINSEELETRVAFLNDGRLEEYQVERSNTENIVGSIYLGKIDYIQKSLQAVFVDIGREKNAFMHFSDMLPASYDETNIKKTKSSQKEKITKKDIPKYFPVGSKIFLQIIKGPIGSKGPRATTNLTLPGRYLVLLPYSDHIGISKKIENSKERERLKKVLSKLNIPKGMGCICRTVGEGRKSIYFKRDLNMLLEHWKNIEKKKSNKKPCLVYKELSLLEKSMRDFLTEDIDNVVIDNKNAYEYIRKFISKVVIRNMVNRVKHYKKATPIFEYYDINKKINKIFERKVYLPSGGYICIDETEALIAIDINTGSTKAGNNKAELILNTNLEAVQEIVRQLRLRNIGGLVVIDFIDMSYQADKEQVLRTMRKLLQNDRAKTKVLPISNLGIMQMTRQRDQESLLERIYDPCPYCSGTGKVKSTLTISAEIQRDLQELLRRQVQNKETNLRVIMHPSVLERMKNTDSEALQSLEDNFGKDLSFRADQNLHLEEYKIIDAKTGDKILY